MIEFLFPQQICECKVEVEFADRGAPLWYEKGSHRMSTEQIAAEVILPGQSGRSLSDAEGPVTSETVERYTPTEDRLNAARQVLEDMGFEVKPGPVTLTIIGSPDLFRKTFGTDFTVERPGQTGQLTAQGNLKVPDALEDLVTAVVFPEPPEFFP